MDFETYSRIITQYYLRLPYEDYVNFFALEALKYGDGYYTLTKNERDDANDFLKYENFIPANVIEESLTQDYLFDSRIPIEITDKTLIQLPTETLDILNECYYEVFLVQKFEDFQTKLLAFIAKYDNELHYQLIESVEELKKLSENLPPIKGDSKKIVNLKEIKFKNIIFKERKKNNEFIKNEYNKLSPKQNIVNKRNANKIKKSIYDFIDNIDNKEEFLNELKNTFPTEKGKSIKAILNKLTEVGILNIGSREFKPFLEELEKKFNRSIGKYQGINDPKEIPEWIEEPIYIKLNPLIDKYKST